MVLQIAIRFYAELNEFLPLDKRQVAFMHRLKERDSVKDVIESLGVPHTEVGLILVNGESVDFSYVVQDGDRISVYPVFESVDVSPLVRVRPRPLAEPRFLADTHLGKLAGYLRMLGFDTLYRNDYDDHALARVSSSEERILLTRDRGLLKRSLVTYGCHIWETDPERQVAEVLRRYDLLAAIAPFRRCMRCNGLLEPVRKEAIADHLLPKTRQYYDEFRLCQGCGWVYWKGSHYERMQRLIERLRCAGGGLSRGGASGTSRRRPPSGIR